MLRSGQALMNISLQKSGLENLSITTSTVSIFLTQGFILNEFDEILSNHIKRNEKIDEDFFIELRGKIFKILITQNGSRVLQKCLKRTSQDVLSNILEEIKFRVHELMVDPYANYFCQKFFGLLTDKDKIIFLKNVNLELIAR
jgi:hypothetical protein